MRHGRVLRPRVESGVNGIAVLGVAVVVGVAAATVDDVVAVVGVRVGRVWVGASRARNFGPAAGETRRGQARAPGGKTRVEAGRWDGCGDRQV